MNNFSDARNSRTPDEATDPIAVEIRAYFRSRPMEPLDTDAFWHSLTARLETFDASSVLTAHAPTRPPSHRKTLQPAVTLRAIRPVNVHVPSTRRAHPLLTNLVAVAAVVALSLAAFALFHRIGPFAPADGSKIQHGELVWQRVTLPTGVVLQEGEGVSVSVNGGTPISSGQSAKSIPNATYQVAASNGEIAYICQVKANRAPLLWRTLDAGQHWSLLAPLPTSEAYQGCDISIDANDALTLVVDLGNRLGGSPTGSSAFVLFDGTTQWQTLMTQKVGAFESAAGAYYLTQDTYTFPRTAGGSVPGHLYISTDRMRSWKVIDAPLVAENIASAQLHQQNGFVGVVQAWAQPNTGELLARTADSVLWWSTNQGKTWTRISLPVLPPEAAHAIVFVQQPVAAHLFTLCALVLDQAQIPYDVAPLYCSTDSGQTWTRRPRTALTLRSDTAPYFEMPRVMLADGELLAWDVQAIYVFPGGSRTAPPAHLLGTIPDPHDPNSIPGGTLGVTAQGVVLWQPLDAQTLYVARYSPAPAGGASK